MKPVFHNFAQNAPIFIKFFAGFGASEEVMACLRQERSRVENPSQTIVNVVAENPAYLHCSVPPDAEHEIAWTRVSDGAILTAGNRTFTRDPRWQVSKKSANIWVLNLRRAEHQDSGCYLCEINDKHNTVYAVYLKVLDPPLPSPASLQKKSTKLMANMSGDEVVLNCTVTSTDKTDNDIDVVWTRDGNSINFNNTEKYILKVKRDAGVVIETMRIRKATMEDDGNYACEHSSQKASQIVHINKAEAQIANYSSPSASLLLSMFLTTVIFRFL
ncbi:hypothetical protein B9Z55_008956 [Caenorhabditis nigoni]|uniref:Ig-like domain-containing protein n=1 Tax=Caenorhabditis nigoni TaxID=1611254 RepID=A0A2G5UQE9_9PELO|nr:hypothetical protein B9Z55_008956 [Caenorhabditis nigoni]